MSEHEHDGIDALEPSKSAVQFIGPFESHVVLVDGWQVPYLEADLLPGGRVHLCLDHRFGIDIEVADVERLVRFIADCIAVAAGFTAHPEGDREPIRSVPFTRMHGIDLG